MFLENQANGRTKTETQDETKSLVRLNNYNQNLKGLEKHKSKYFDHKLT